MFHIKFYMYNYLQTLEIFSHFHWHVTLFNFSFLKFFFFFHFCFCVAKQLTRRAVDTPNSNLELHLMAFELLQYYQGSNYSCLSDWRRHPLLLAVTSESPYLIERSCHAHSPATLPPIVSALANVVAFYSYLGYMKERKKEIPNEMDKLWRQKDLKRWA